MQLRSCYPPTLTTTSAINTPITFPGFFPERGCKHLLDLHDYVAFVTYHGYRVRFTGKITGNWIAHRDHAAVLTKLISTIILSIIKVGILGTQTSKGTRRSEKKTINEKPRKSRMKGYTTFGVRYWMSEQVSLLVKKDPHSINIQISLKEELKVNSYWMVLLPLAVRKSQARS